jgi:NAD(P)H-dependent flavin oxidoreductase YrpB (nitropropane dioxygenase family)
LKNVWSAGQGVGLIKDILPAAEVVRRLMAEYDDSLAELKNFPVFSQPNQASDFES